MVKVVIIILNYNTYQDTIKQVREFLPGIRENSRILIVDNASPNDSFLILNKEFRDEPYVEVIATPNNCGFARGNNFGLKYAEKYNPEFVCVVNNDVHFSWETLFYLCDIYSKLDHPAILSPIQVLPDGKNAPLNRLEIPSFKTYLRTYSMIFKTPQHKYETNVDIPNVQRVEWIPGAFGFISYKVFKELGFFDECTFLYGEESFLAHKVKDSGLNNYIIINHTYVHDHSKTISTVFSDRRKQRMMFEGRILYLRKYSPRYIKAKIFVLAILYHINMSLHLAISILKN